MDLATFIQKRRPDWVKLEQMLDFAQGSGLKGFADEEAIEFGRLYRSAASDLNHAQTFVSGDEVVSYLNQLVARGYMLSYGGRKPVSIGWLLVSAFNGYARALREFAPYWLTSTGIFLLGVAVGTWMAFADPAFIETVMPPGFSHIRPDHEDEKLDREGLNQMVGLYFGNNVRVTLYVYALGLTFGIGTCWLLFTEGLRIAALAVLFYQAGEMTKFFAELLPHGVVELPAIFLGAGAGLMLARAMIVARPWSRLDEMASRGKDSLRLLWGIIPLLAAAAILEAWVARLPNWFFGEWAKLIVATCVGFAFIAYIVFAGRGGQRHAVALVRE